jgi:hypothetical protein
MAYAQRAFEADYPAISDFVERFGWIEIGQNETISAFVRAYDEGGTVDEGKDSYPSMESALQDLENGVKAFMDEHGLHEI